MITLYHSVSARSFRPLWALEELRIPYDLVMLPFPPRAHSPNYLSTNPLGTVPLLVDDGVRMTESAAICEFLAMRYDAGGLAVKPEDQDYGAYLNFLHFGEATLTFPQTLVLRYGRFEPPERRSEQVVADYTRWFLSRLKGIENALVGKSFLSADRFTAADISVGYALMLAEYLGLAHAFPPLTKEYRARLRLRPAFLRALDGQEQAAVNQGVATTPASLV